MFHRLIHSKPTNLNVKVILPCYAQRRQNQVLRCGVLSIKLKLVKLHPQNFESSVFFKFFEKKCSLGRFFLLKTMTLFSFFTGSIYSYLRTLPNYIEMICYL